VTPGFIYSRQELLSTQDVSADFDGDGETV